MKLLKFEKREFDHESYAYHTIDAMAMERLTSSKSIIDEYGFCGQSVLTEYASGNARTHIKKPSFNSKERLKMARDLAIALSAIHSIDYPNSTNATFAHNDINIANAVEVNGRIKLNDFNIGVLMRWNQTEPCGYPSRFENKMWKSPEDVINASYVDPALSDMYGLGNLLFQIMTTHQPWTHLEPQGPLDKDQVVQRKRQGKLPFIPLEFFESSKTAIQALLYGVLACYRFHPQDRLTSHELAQALETALQWASSRTTTDRSNNNVTRREIAQLFEKQKKKKKSIS